jgi:pilus assembly protein FimV
MEVVVQTNGGWVFEHALMPTLFPFAHWLRAQVRATFLIIGVGLFAGTSAHAVGLGALHLQSALGQPLQLQISLLAASDVDLDAHCYKAKVFSLDGVSLGKTIIDLKSDGSTNAISISTAQSIHEPALMVRVDYNCASQTRREYQVLLDFMPVSPSVVEASHARTEQASVEKRTPESTTPVASGPAFTEAQATIKKSKHHRKSTEIQSTYGSIEIPTNTDDAAKERRHKKILSKGFRSVLHLANDDVADTSLNDAAGMHLALSRNLSSVGDAGSAAVGEAPPAQSTPSQPSAAPTGLNTTDAAPPIASPSATATASVQTADTALQELQAKIRILEAETNELKKLNAQHLAALKIAQTDKNAGSSMLYLYFLLFASFVAIAWLVWRTQQIQSEMKHSSWHEILPEQDADDEDVIEHDRDDVFLEQEIDDTVANNVRPLKSVPKPSSVEPGEMLAFVPVSPPKTIAATANDESGDGDYKFNTNVRTALPNAEEILDEIQQAEFWMDMQQPQRAIEILESHWNVERPSSPLPWLYLFDLYRLVDDHEKYEELTERFERLFNCKVLPWGDGHVVEHSRSLEEFPFLMKKLIELWPTDQLVPFLENLLVDDRDGRRQGFDLASYREILFLTNIAYEIHSAQNSSKAPLYVPEWSANK